MDGNQSHLSTPGRTTHCQRPYCVKRVATYVFWICTFLVLVGLSCRLVWRASQLETGFQTLRLQWTDATLGLILGKRTPVPSREPILQARVWLDEIDRRLPSIENDAEMMIGAALLLDSPAQDYQSNYIAKIESIPGFQPIPTMNGLGIKIAEDAFEAECKKELLELATKATEIDPTNVDWWRLRALLLWRESMHSSVDSPRVDNWLEVLHEASKHDPDNSLYDYLAANHYWESSAEFDFQDVKVRLVVTNDGRFDLGISQFQQGQKKPFCAIGDAGFSAVAKFLSDSRTPLIEHERIINGRFIHARRSSLLFDLCRWQCYRADAVAEQGNVRTALAIQLEKLRLLDQFAAADPLGRYDGNAIAWYASTTTQISTLALEHKELFSAKEVEAFQAMEENAHLIDEINLQVGRELAKSLKPLPTGIANGGSPAKIALAMVARLAPSLVVVLVLIGLLAFAFYRTIDDHNELPRVGVLECSLSLTAAFLFPVAFFGLAPSKMVPQEIQAWTLTGLILTSPIGLMSWIAWTWLRRRAFKFSLFSLLTCVFAFSILFGIVGATRASTGSFAHLPFDLDIPARGWSGLDANSLEAGLGAQPRWLWATMQWRAYYGHYLTLLVWAAIVGFIAHFKSGRAQMKTDENPTASRNFFVVWTRGFGRACLTLSALMMILYLGCAFPTIEETEQHFQERIAFARCPGDHWSKVDRLVQDVRSNPELMDQLRALVKTTIARDRQLLSE